jgi:hypothetical protein
MTKDEIIQGLQFTIDMFLFDPTTGEMLKDPRNDMGKTTIDACKGAIELLEQQPCEDAISRQAAIETAKQYWYKPDIAGALAELPPVQPKPKMGHWIEGQTDNPNIHNILCSCCFEGYPSKGHANSQYTKEKFQWCPKCGAKMVERQAQESEDKDSILSIV